jgi:DNA repair protein RadC
MKLQGLGEFRVQVLRECPPELWTFTVDTPEGAAEYWRRHVATDERFNPDVEVLVVLCVNTRRRAIGHTVVATGTLDTVLAHPREVFCPAILAKSAAIILMHNHPSGDPSPSVGDIKVTKEMIQGGNILKVEVLDHVIMGYKNEGRGKDFCSLRELGYFN